jgi:dolichol-phosphate mannosyltransferase
VTPADPLISVVVPAYNEAGALEALSVRVDEALAGVRVEVLFVNDGSHDGTREVIDRLAAAESRRKGIHLSRNFGHQAAILAGLMYARGDALIVMDADMQDDPASLPRLVDKWREGFDVVYAIRVGRKEGAWKRAAFHAFYRLFNAASGSAMPLDAGNFGLVDRKVYERLRDVPERDRYLPGLRHWLGFRQTGIEIERAERYDGTPRVTTAGLFRLAKTAVFSFSTLPLTVFYGIAALSALGFVALAFFTLVQKLVMHTAILGWTSTVMTACFFGALNALGIAILGEYVVRIYDQVRGRPAFVVERTVNLGDEGDAAAPPPRVPRS